MATEDEALKRRIRQFEAAKKPMSQEAFQAAYVARLVSLKRAALVEADLQKPSAQPADEQPTPVSLPESQSPPAAAEPRSAPGRPAGELQLCSAFREASQFCSAAKAWKWT